MRIVTINKVIKAKVNQWLKSITDVQLREDLKDKIVVTGGCITSMLLQEDPNDYDIYFTDLETTQRVAKYYLPKIKDGEKCKIYLADGAGQFDHTEKHNKLCEDLHVHVYIPSDGFLSEDKGHVDPLQLMEELEAVEDSAPSDITNKEETPNHKEKYRPVFVTSNAITLSDKIQLITRFSGNPEKIHENFDFDHTKLWFSMEEGVVTNTKSLECVLARRLIYSGSKFPLCSIIRTRKFINRGWSLDAGQYVKMAIQLADLDLRDPYILSQQLIGVDTSYFQWVLSIITKEEILIDGRVDMQHLMRLINKVFDD
tara:strand:+ start:139 stop:1077 length:939 start_codon:yes stop_codon:yes gene_type:complete